MQTMLDSYISVVTLHVLHHVCMGPACVCIAVAVPVSALETGTLSSRTLCHTCCLSTHHATLVVDIVMTTMLLGMSANLTHYALSSL